MNQALDVLLATRELLSVQARWTQNRMARDTNGNTVSHDSETASCWCLLGAVKKNIPSTYKIIDNLDTLVTHPSVHILKQVLKMNHISQIFEFNDEATYETIVATLDSAIEQAKLIPVEAS